MALVNNTNYNNGPLVFLNMKAKTKDKDGKEVEIERPYFEVARIVDGKITKTEETANKVTGNLTKIDFKEREYKGVVTKHVVLYISDPDSKETYCLDLRPSLTNRSLFNALLSLKGPNNIAISVYRSKKGYESYGLDQDGEKVSWKFEIKELPQPDVIRDKKGVVVKTDWSETDEFFESRLRALAASFFPGSDRTNEPAKEPAQQPATKSQNVEKEKSDEDIPF